jgi:hypothetical protein
LDSISESKGRTTPVCVVLCKNGLSCWDAAVLAAAGRADANFDEFGALAQRTPVRGIGYVLAQRTPVRGIGYVLAQRTPVRSIGYAPSERRA